MSENNKHRLRTMGDWNEHDKYPKTGT